MLTRFTSMGRKVAPNDLIDLRHRLGGKLGNLTVGAESITVLKLGENVYAGTEKATPAMRAALELEQADLHVIKTNADLTYFAARYREFKGALKEEKHGQG